MYLLHTRKCSYPNKKRSGYVFINKVAKIEKNNHKKRFVLRVLFAYAQEGF